MNGKIINDAGNTLFKKIMRLVSDKYIVNEKNMMAELNKDLLSEVLGFEII